MNRLELIGVEVKRGTVVAEVDLVKKVAEVLSEREKKMSATIATKVVTGK